LTRDCGNFTTILIFPWCSTRETVSFNYRAVAAACRSFLSRPSAVSSYVEAQTPTTPPLDSLDPDPLTPVNRGNTFSRAIVSVWRDVGVQDIHKTHRSFITAHNGWSQNDPQVSGRFSPAVPAAAWCRDRILGLANGRSASSSFPHQAARVLWCCRRSRLALPAGDLSDSGLSARNVSRRSWVARQHFPRTTT
jgi:hypothetical protein